MKNFTVKMAFTFNRVRKFYTKSALHKNVQLTKDRFPSIKRGSYASVDSTDVNYFKQLLGSNHFITGEEVKSYNEDWLKSVSGNYLSTYLHNICYFYDV